MAAKQGKTSRGKPDSKAKPHTMPTRRDMDFTLPADKISGWNNNDVHLSQFMNTLSMLFPVGERFFIDSVRAYRDQITDPELKKAVTAFIGQEAMHGREHEEYNAALYQAIPETVGMERFVANLLGFAQKRLPKAFNLSATIALEHFTAVMADGLLRMPELLEGADPVYADIWNWHALEETEHKAVAFDVWLTVMGRNPRAYAIRSTGMILAAVILWTILARNLVVVMHKERRLTDWRGWLRFANSMAGNKPGYLRRLVLPWLDYFRPGFHPWDHDNSEFLEQLESLSKQYLKTQAA